MFSFSTHLKFYRTTAGKSTFRTQNDTEKANFRCTLDKKYYSDSAPSYGMVQKWFTFRCSRTSTETILSTSRPNEITTPEMFIKIHDIVLNDPKMKVRAIAEIISISTERVINILHTHLCMKKLWLVFFGMYMDHLHRLPWERKDDFWSILCCIIGSIGWRSREETIWCET